MSAADHSRSAFRHKNLTSARAPRAVSKQIHPKFCISNNTEARSYPRKEYGIIVTSEKFILGGMRQ